MDLIFALSYQQQLRRTRPGLFTSLENSIIKLIEECGGKVQKEHKFLTASFDEHTIAFWLDMVILIEKLEQLLKNSSDELYGYACLIGYDVIGQTTYPGILRELASHGNYTGIWLAENISPRLQPYFEFDDTPRVSLVTKTRIDAVQIRNAKNIAGTGDAVNSGYPLRNTIIDVLEKQKKHPYIVLCGPDFIGLKDGLYHFSKKQLGDFPPLVFRFGSGGRGLSCIVDALGPEIKEFFRDQSSQETVKQLETLGEPIARERLRDENTPAIKEKAEQFLSLLVDTYVKNIKRQKIDPLMIVENIEEIDEAAGAFIIQKVRELQNQGGVSICCTTNNEKKLDALKPLGFKVMLFSLPGGKHAETSTGKNLSRDMKELWEIAYMCYLMRPYFPGYAFLSLFSEEGKNPAVISRAFDILNTLGVITSEQDPEPVMVDFAGKAKKVLGERTGIIQGMVRNRLLAWVTQGKLLPCFNLLTALVKLEGDGGDDLILDAMYRDVTDGVYARLKDSINSGKFNTIAGTARTPSLVYIFNTLLALIHGDETSIRETFLYSPPPEGSPSPRYMSYILSNLAAYQLSIRTLEDAAESVKKSMMAAQTIKNSRGGARAFRLYALVNLAQGELSDAIEYLEFAAEHAERTKDREEAAVIDYYSSVVHFLFGNISKAERLADDAESGAWGCGIASWAAKARFIKGRILFEKGKYQDAYDTFESIPVTEETEDTLNAWKYRTRIYSRGFSSVPVTNTGDGALFMIEAAYLNREYGKAVELADQLLMNLPDHNFIFIEQSDWQSGFSQIELLLFPKMDLWYRLVSTYRALALSEQKAGESANQAVSIMQQITRDEKFPDTDINDAFYYFAYYKVLQNADASEIDLNTLVSMAFKRLQRRASRIDNIETKRAFLSLNRWNESLGEAAKHHKLI